MAEENRVQTENEMLKILYPERYAQDENALANQAYNVQSALDNPVLAPLLNSPTPTEIPMSAMPMPTRAPAALSELDMIDLQMKPFADQKNALEEMAKASMIGNNESINAISKNLMSPEAIKLNQDRIAQIQADQIAKQKEVEATTAKVGKTLDEYNNLGVNSNRLWQNMSTGNKIMAGLGVFLGGLGGGQNNALKIIDKAIDNDITEQKAMIEKKGNTATQQRGLLADLRNQLGSMQSAESAYRSIAATNVQNQLSIISAKTNNAKVKAQADMAISQLEQNKTKLLTDIIKNAKVAMAEEMFGPTYKGLTEGEKAALKRLPPEQRAKFVSVPELGIKGIMSGTNEDNSKMKTALSDAASSISILDDLGKINTAYLPLTEKQKKADTLRGLLIGRLKTFLVGAGAINEEEWKRIDKMIPNPADIGTARANYSLTQLKNELIKGMRKTAEVNNLGVGPIPQRSTPQQVTGKIGNK